MRPRYKLGDTVFFTLPTDAEGKNQTQSFGVIRKYTITVDRNGSHIVYFTDGAEFTESDILGRASIQKPRQRRSRSRTKNIQEALTNQPVGVTTTTVPRTIPNVEATPAPLSGASANPAGSNSAAHPA